jgi:hypothetical protein
MATSAPTNMNMDTNTNMNTNDIHKCIKIGWDIGIKNMSYCRVRPITQELTNIQLTTNPVNQSNNIIKIGTN